MSVYTSKTIQRNVIIDEEAGTLYVFGLSSTVCTLSFHISYIMNYEQALQDISITSRDTFLCVSEHQLT